MSRWLSKILYWAQRFAVQRTGALMVFATLIIISQPTWDQGWPFWFRLSVVVAFASMLITRALIGQPKRAGGRRRQLDRFEFGLIVLSNIYLWIAMAGGHQTWAQPLAFIAVAYLVGFNTRSVGLLLTLVALVLQIALHGAGSDARTDWAAASINCGYIALFALANMLFVQIEIMKRRREHERRLVQELRAMRQEARDFRLISSALSSSGPAQRRALDEAKLARGAVDSIHQSMYLVLSLLKRSLDLQTCVLLWLDASGRQLRIKELVSDSNMVRETPIPARAGALGGILKNRLLLNLSNPRGGGRTIPYYDGPERVGAFAGVPVLEDGHLRGVLCADRRSDRPLTKEDERLLLDAAQQVLRAIQTERTLSAVERSKYEHERFYRASTMLNGALTLRQVYDTVFRAAAEIACFDFGAVTLFDQEKRQHTVCRVLGEDPDGFEGQTFGNNAGLVSMVVKNKHFLPAGDSSRERDPIVFTRKLRLRGMKSLVVLPLIVQDNAVGTIVLASRRVAQFSKQVREMLGVISNQVAVSIENATMYKRMEEMATTDGLTELPNHRTFQARLSEMLARAERHSKPVTVVLTDVDKFKSINDTYGHPIGDMVLKRMSAVLADQVRKVDVVARYGGEEFAIILEETDREGALLLCERVRSQVASELIATDKGTFHVTISLGIASYPSDGTHKQQLIERADQALYAAKKGGRNRTVCFADIAAAERVAS